MLPGFQAYEASTRENWQVERVRIGEAVRRQRLRCGRT